ncbi:TonB-dependent receptor [Steroidobacter agaridevorans]|uniref:TonB-dependent receptor n=1 Tax=Steroidobacter agaridevorans TaxID=2695856 RepID=A0A829YGF5_9GAMM|nr:TonB-dependent receptor [Steroidobacter agaridevorans]GFE82407.1 TonB-dependent receptor [Steroidobacter agaridevorans]
MMNRNLLSRTTAAAALLTQFSMPAMAQEVARPTQAKATELEEIVVVGTQIAGAAPVGSDPVVVSREDAALTGLANPADILRRMPQVVSGDVGFQGGTANQGYNGSQMDTINLRGLGAGATLVLVDGRRVVGAGGAATATDANQVPLAALERLEILTDGASAVYGSDAVAGVVNFVLRKDYDGVEATARVDDQSGGTQYGATLIAGTVWEDLGGLGGGNILVTYEHLDRESFNAGKIARLRQDLRPLGGPDLRVYDDDATVGFSPNIISQGLPNSTIPQARAYTYWGVPSGDGTGLTAGSLALNQPNLVEGADYKDWTGEQVRDQLAVYFNQSLTTNLELFGSLSYTDRETVSEHLSPTVKVPLLGTPYFIAGLPANQTVQYSTLKDGQTRVFSAQAETIGAVLGLRASLPGNWAAEAYLNYGRNQQCDSCVTGAINTAALTAQAQAGNINPLSSVPLTAAQLDLVYGNSRFESRTTLEDAVLKFNGPLFDLPAGPVRAAVGGEFRTEANANRNLSRTGPTNALTQLSNYDGSEFDRDIGSVFLELNIPLVNRGMDVALIRSLTLSASARYDDYSDVGGTTNPRLGFNWDLTDQFSLRGSWGTSFRAPSVTDANPYAVTSGTPSRVPNYDPRITNGVLPPGFLGPFGIANAALMLGSNPDLVPEESENWSLGASFEHEGFNIGLTYWNISFDNQIIFPGSIPAYLQATPASVPANGGNYDGWGALIIPVNNPASCNNADLGTADPTLQRFLESVNYDFVSSGGDYSFASPLKNDFCRVNVIIDSRIQNVGSVEQSGIDFNTSYAHQLGDVNLIGQLALSYQLENDISTGPGVPAVSQIGNLTDPTSLFEWRGTAGLTALWNGFDATVMARYLDSMLATGQLGANGLPGPDRNMSSYTVFDLTLGYGAEFDERRLGVLRGWRAQVAITNVADDEPDFMVTSGDSSGAAWNFKYGLPFGRTYSAQLTARF